VLEPKAPSPRRGATATFREWVAGQDGLTVTVRGIVAGGYDIGHCLDGDRVALVPEPTNEFDPHAIRVDA
jgi:hypothetical protein